MNWLKCKVPSPFIQLFLLLFFFIQLFFFQSNLLFTYKRCLRRSGTKNAFFFLKKTVLGENIRFSRLLFATGDISRGETSFILAKRPQRRRARRNGCFRRLSSEWRFSVKTPTSRLRLDGRKRMEYDFGDHILLVLRMFCRGCYLTIVLPAF